VYLQATIVVQRTLESVCRFLEDPRNLTKWDRSVAKVAASAGPMGVGYTFGPSSRGDGKRSCYRIVEFQRSKLARAELLDPRPFKSANWLMRVEPAVAGTTVVCGVELTFKWTSLAITPVLWVNRRALSSDLVFLKRALESEAV
jgi:polyketide cyclase/dehydrase/lipid transport protein